MDGRGIPEDRSAGPAQLGNLDVQRRDHPRARPQISPTSSWARSSFTELTSGCWSPGRCPRPPSARVLDATLVAIAEHGLVPSVQVARMTLAAAPEALQGAVAAGILGCGSVVLGSSEAAGRFFAEVAERAREAPSLDVAITAVVGEYRAAAARHPGLMAIRCTRARTRAHSACWRFRRKAGLAGRHIEIAAADRAAAAAAARSPLALNVSGAHSRGAAGCRLPAAGAQGRAAARAHRRPHRRTCSRSSSAPSVS